MFPGEELWKGSLYRNCVYYNKKVFFIPYNAKALAIYDTEKNIVKKMPINDFGVQSYKYYNAVVYEDKIYIFGENAPALSVFNTKSNKIEYSNELFGEIDKRKNTDVLQYLGRELATDGGKTIYLHSKKCQSLIEFHLQDMTFDIIPFEKGKGIFSYIIKSNDFLCLVPVKGERFTLYNTKTKHVTYVGEPLKEWTRYYAGFAKKDEIWIFPDLENHILKICAETGNVEKIPVTEYIDERFIPKGKKGFQSSKFLFVDETTNEILYFSRMNRTLYRVEKETGRIKKKQFFMELPNRAEYVLARMTDGEDRQRGRARIMEALRFTLKDHIDWTVQNGWKEMNLGRKS